MRFPDIKVGDQVIIDGRVIAQVERVTKTQFTANGRRFRPMARVDCPRPLCLGCAVRQSVTHPHHPGGPEMSTPIGQAIPVTIGTHGWSGSCAPGSRNSCWSKKTFSVGCFQWVPSAVEGMAKKGKVIVRVYGRKDNPVPVFEEADRICQELDAGTYAGPKTIRVS